MVNGKLMAKTNFHDFDATAIGLDAKIRLPRATRSGAKKMSRPEAAQVHREASKGWDEDP
jgi:hypothetical protein